MHSADDCTLKQSAPMLAFALDDEHAASSAKMPPCITITRVISLNLYGPAVNMLLQLLEILISNTCKDKVWKKQKTKKLSRFFEV